MAVTNEQRLTRGHRKLAAKRKASSVPEVKFDRDSREEFLAGFHKRKLARQSKAKRKAEEMNRTERLAERQRIREERKQIIGTSMERLKEAEDIINNAESRKNGSVEKPEEEEAEEAEEFDGFDDKKGVLKRSIYGQSQVTFEEINLDPYVDVSKSKKVLEEATEKAHNYAAYVKKIENDDAKEAAKQERRKKKKFRYLPKSERKLMRKKTR